jgi:hypothetical protein
MLRLLLAAELNRSGCWIGSRAYNKWRKSVQPAMLHSFRGRVGSSPMTSVFRSLSPRRSAADWLKPGLAVAAAATLALTGCSQTQDAAKQAASSVGDAAKTAATGAATGASNAALTTAVTPVLDLLGKAETQLKTGNVAEVTATMGGFGAIWGTAKPVIQPLAGDKWPMIEKAADQLSTTFAKGTPSAADATSALTGLMGPLSALVGK